MGTETVFERNITHNLNKMADAADLYEALWRPEATKAIQLVPLLLSGLNNLVINPQKYKALNPPNNWGDYYDLVEFVTHYLIACVENPDAEISVSR